MKVRRRVVEVAPPRRKSQTLKWPPSQVVLNVVALNVLKSLLAIVDDDEHNLIG